MDVNLPPQRKSYKAKNKTWRKECVDALDTSTSLYNNDTVRRRIKHKIINQDLYEGRLHIENDQSSVLAENFQILES